MFQSIGYWSSKFEETHVEEVPKREVKMLLSNKVAIITGGARGIGRGIALRFVEEGCSVVITDLLTAEGRQTAEEISKKGRDAIFIKCDVTNRNQVEEMVDQVIKKFGKVDIRSE